MTMTFADQVTLALHLYDNPDLTQVRSSYRLPRCNAESIGFYHNGVWYGVLKSRGKVVAVLLSEANKNNVHIINIAAFDRTGKRHLAKWVTIKEAVYGVTIPVFDVEGLQNI